MTWTLESALSDDLIDLIERNDASGVYAFRLGNLKTPIKIALCRSPIMEETRYDISHHIHTPTQAGPHNPSRTTWDYPAYALHMAISVLTSHYKTALGEGHAPKENWLIPNAFSHL